MFDCGHSQKSGKGRLFCPLKARKEAGFIPGLPGSQSPPPPHTVAAHLAALVAQRRSEMHQGASAQDTAHRERLSEAGPEFDSLRRTDESAAALCRWSNKCGKGSVFHQLSGHYFSPLLAPPPLSLDLPHLWLETKTRQPQRAGVRGWGGGQKDGVSFPLFLIPFSNSGSLSCSSVAESRLGLSLPLSPRLFFFFFSLSASLLS